ncbi:LuxR C-terminal-related transcriptional regulator [Streptomyces sp. NPDC002835]
MTAIVSPGGTTDHAGDCDVGAGPAPFKIQQCTNMNGGLMCGKPDGNRQNAGTRLCGLGIARYREAVTRGRILGEIPECLTRTGLVRPIADDPTAHAPVPPDIAASHHTRPVQQEILDQQQTLLRIQDSFAEAERIYDEVRQRTAASGRLLQGQTTIYAALREAADNCREEALTLQPGGARPQAVLATVLPWEFDMIGRGVRRRTLYQHSARSDAPTLAYMEQLTAVGGQIRTVDELFDRLVIYDRTIAFIPDPRVDQRENALLIEHPGIVRYLARVFDHAWDRADPVTFGTPQSRPAPLTDRKRRTVLRLMVDGHTDRAIAARLGMSTRTVANHVKAVSDQLGSRSRAQLAYRLAQSGLLDDIET